MLTIPIIVLLAIISSKVENKSMKVFKRGSKRGSRTVKIVTHGMILVHLIIVGPCGV